MRRENMVIRVAWCVWSAAAMFVTTVYSLRMVFAAINVIENKMKKKLTPEQKEFCESNGLQTSPEFYTKRDLKKMNKAITMNKVIDIMENRVKFEEIMNV